jgi:hypothetical protein
MWSLQSFEFAKAMDAWFGFGDLTRAKSCFYVAARIRREIVPLLLAADTSYSPGGTFCDLLFPLVSDNAIERDALSVVQQVLDSFPTDRPVYGADLPRLALAALDQRVAEVEARARRILSEGDEPFYDADYKFFLALAKGDEPEMLIQISRLVTPETLAEREDLESGYTSGLISTYAVIYAKLAWLWGYRIQPNSPFVPAEWLPIVPLAKYEFPYDFLDPTA